MPVYLDNNASTPLIPEALEAMRPFLGPDPGNPASSHRFGRRVRAALEDAREKIAALLDADPDEVIFTSGATEANNLAIFGLAGNTGRTGTIVTSPVEHPCVVEPIRQLIDSGYGKIDLPVETAGSIALGQVDAFPNDTRLVSVMLANHETGAIQPIDGLVAKLDGRAPFHCDAAAAAGKIPVAFHRLGVTALTISAHKLHGPPGIGALLVKKNVKLRPLFFGGHQQRGLRPGSEPVALACGFAAALQWCEVNRQRIHARVIALRQQLLDRLRATIAPIVLNGSEQGGIPQTLNISFPGCRADMLLMKLDLAGIACSTGSACSSGSLLPSPVLRAMGLPAEYLNSAMRFSLSSLLLDADIQEAAEHISNCVKELRLARLLQGKGNSPQDFFDTNH